MHSKKTGVQSILVHWKVLWLFLDVKGVLWSPGLRGEAHLRAGVPGVKRPIGVESPPGESHPISALVSSPFSLSLSFGILAATVEALSQQEK